MHGKNVSYFAEDERRDEGSEGGAARAGPHQTLLAELLQRRRGQQREAAPTQKVRSGDFLVFCGYPIGSSVSARVSSLNLIVSTWIQFMNP